MRVIRGPQRHVKRALSAIQRNRRNAFRKCCRSWRVNADSHARDAWQSFATEPETAFNAFMRINLVRVFDDLEPLTQPPTD